mgnify:CR=1 FL=1
MVYTPSGQQGLRNALEEVYQRRDLVHLGAGSKVPLLRNHVWLVTRGMVKLSCMNEQGDDLLLGLAGPNEIFGEPLTNIDLYEATTIGDSDLLCLSIDEIESTPHLAITLVRAMTSRMRQSEALIALLGLRRIEERGANETARRALGDLSAICRYAVVTGRALSDPCRDLRGALTPKVVRHFAAVTDPKAMPPTGFKGRYGKAPSAARRISSSVRMGGRPRGLSCATDLL